MPQNPLARVLFLDVRKTHAKGGSGMDLQAPVEKNPCQSAFRHGLESATGARLSSDACLRTCPCVCPDACLCS